ncbi:Uncharacterised protein [Mycobacteroides abscessus subsp. abscessus]|nr:Uncharacterised protein [Mycobacteroides abscessus subsp. abscessus]
MARSMPGSEPGAASRSMTMGPVATSTNSSGGSAESGRAPIP